MSMFKGVEKGTLNGDVQMQWESVKEQEGGKEVLKGEKEDLKHVKCDRYIRRQRGSIGRREGVNDRLKNN